MQIIGVRGSGKDGPAIAAGEAPALHAGPGTSQHHAPSELKTGTFHAMLKQLGIDERDLYE